MFVLRIPSNRIAERTYVARVLLGEFLGLEFRVQEASPNSPARLYTASEPSVGIIFGDNLLAKSEKDWFTPSSLPVLPLREYEAGPVHEFSFRRLPILYPSSGPLSRENEKDILIDFDLFGSAFALLTQYEERCHSTRDAHQRLPATESISGKANLLGRPVVDEYTRLLSAAILSLWPETRFRKRSFQITPTHDVDWPFEYRGMNFKRAARRAAGEGIRGRSLGRSVSVLSGWLSTRRGDWKADPFFRALNQMIDDDSRAGLTGIFYFMTGHTDSRYDTNYDLRDPEIRATLRRVHEGGHLIGLHNSYGTLDDQASFQAEYDLLRSVCEEEKIRQDKWYVRSHFLRWRTPTSFAMRERLKFDVDSTLGFADAPGFRCGTCHEFSTFDLDGRKHLKLVEQPLIAMECSLIDGYQRMRHSDALVRFQNLREECKKADGNFVFLWHNSRFRSSEDWLVYRALMKN